MNSNRDVEQKDSTPAQITYPQKDKRYTTFWWNRSKQFCYTDEDVTLLGQIKGIYNSIIGDDKANNYFSLTDEKEWREWWTCIKPSTISVTATLVDDSFTLPNREAKDSKAYPLWNFADNIARKIANWQSDRLKNQDRDLMNDPVMLIFDELRDWFFVDLAEKECKLPVLDDIAKRQSYIKSLIHLVPHFGPDRLRLHEIQQTLDNASQLLRACVANKELPQLLSDLIISGKSLETTLGTYLHFLLIDEEVSDNFSPDSLGSSESNCDLSPICRIYKTSQIGAASSEISERFSKHHALNRFYEVQTIGSTSESIQAKLTLRENLLSTVKFASFTTKTDKTHYLEALATVEALMNVRKTLEKFNHVQTSLGTYVFAINYFEQANSLAAHYINMISRSKQLISNLIKAADEGHSRLLANPRKEAINTHFEKNLRALETRFAKGTTVLSQLNTFCQRTIVSMQKYQDEMKKLAVSVQSGEASREIEIAMRDLYDQMSYLNTVLPAMLGEPYLTIKTPPGPSPRQIDRGSTGECAHNDACEKGSDASCDADEKNDLADNIHTPAPAAPTAPIEFSSGKWDIEFDDATKTPIFVVDLFQDNASVGNLVFHGKLKDTKQDPTTNTPIYVYTYGDMGAELGTAEFYGHPYFCLTADRTQHNIIKLTGVLSDFHLSDENQAKITTICTVTPPSFASKALHDVGSSALHGFLRGGANALSARLTEPGISRKILSQFTYFGCVFTVKFGYYASEMSVNEMAADPIRSLYYPALRAAYDTGQAAFISIGISILGGFLDSAGDLCNYANLTRLGDGLKKSGSMVRYGFFAYNTLSGSDFSTPTNAAKTIGIAAASIAAGTTTEAITEKQATLLLGNSR